MSRVQEITSNRDGLRRVDRIHLDGAVQFSYIEISEPSEEVMDIELYRFDRIDQIEQVSDFGTLVRGLKENKSYTLWLPGNILNGSIDSYKRILVDEHERIPYAFMLENTVRLKVLSELWMKETAFYGFLAAEDEHLSLSEELKDIYPAERRTYIKADWFCARSQADIWKYLINGFIYDPGPGRGSGKRFICQQCAYSWWMYFDMLASVTSKKIYDVFQDELAQSVVNSLSPEGAWRHGAWSDEMEIHARFQLDGIQLLLAQYEKTRDQYWLKSAEFAMEYLIKNMSVSASGDRLWFLHDSIEDLKKHRIASPVLGSRDIHSYTINTHIQALFVLARLSPYSDRLDGDKIVKSGLTSLKSILELAPAEGLYALVVPWFVRHRLRGATGKRLDQVIKIIEKKYLIPLYWFLRKRYPRILYPNGLTERDLTITFMPFNYHVINVKDMLTLYQFRPEPWLEVAIRKSFKFIRFLTELSQFRYLLKNDHNYIEVYEVYQLYSNMIETIPESELLQIQELLFEVTGGFSLDAAFMTNTRNRKQGKQKEVSNVRI